MGAGISTDAIPAGLESGLQTYHPPPRQSYYSAATPPSLPPYRQSYYISTATPPQPKLSSHCGASAVVPPPQPPQARSVSAQQPSNYCRVGQVTAFHSPSKWKAYYEASKSSNKLIVIEFTASWCGPCRSMEPILNHLAAIYTDVDFIKINVDEFLDVASQFRVQVMPTLLLMKKGVQIDKVVGVKKQELQMKIDKHLHINQSNS